MFRNSNETKYSDISLWHFRPSKIFFYLKKQWVLVGGITMISQRILDLKKISNNNIAFGEKLVDIFKL